MTDSTVLTVLNSQHSPLETLPPLRSVLSADQLGDTGVQPGSHIKQEKHWKCLSALPSLLPGLYFWSNYLGGEPQVGINKISAAKLSTIIFSLHSPDEYLKKDLSRLARALWRLTMTGTSLSWS